jgi:glycerol-3-phosphate dehydrogenase
MPDWRAAALNAGTRATALARLGAGEPVDVVVIGGGITGVGAALDAASRGLSVALLERGDLAQGTSRWSSKLVHGGLRYLAHGQVGVAAESARERGILMTRTAAHLVRPVPFVLPLGRDVSAGSAATLRAGYAIGDALRTGARTPRHILPRARRVTAVEARALAPALRADGLRGALLGWDGQLEDDARLVVAVARTAAMHGALVVTRCAVTAVERGRVHARDERTGEKFEIAARHVVNATGVWAGELAPDVRLMPSKGAHVLVRAERLGHPRAVINVPADERGSRFVFGIPLPDGLVAIGLTDDPFTGPIPDQPVVEPGEERFLLETFSRALASPLATADVVGRYAGLRPLLAVGDAASSDLSRRHAVVEDAASGMLTIVGGKLTTYRRMAQDVVDRITSRDGVTARPCRTHRLPLVGAGAADATQVPPRLRRRYGSEAAAVTALADRRPELLKPVADGVPVLGVELAFAVQAELALTPEDLLDRRTRIGLVPEDRAVAQAAARAAIESATGPPAGLDSPRRYAS